MGLFREWLRAEVSAAIRPELTTTRLDIERSLDGAANAILAEIKRAQDAEARALSAQRLELEHHAETVMEALNEAHTRFATERATQHTQMRILLEDLEHLVERVTRKLDVVPATDHAVRGRMASADSDIDLTNTFAPGTPVEARSRFSDTWFGGLEVSAVVPAPNGISRYRVWRERDHREVPLLFGHEDLRLVAEVEDTRATADL